jgi:hypothetical protein
MRLCEGLVFVIANPQGEATFRLVCIIKFVYL